MHPQKSTPVLLAACLAGLSLPAFGAPAIRYLVSNDVCLISICPIDVPPPTTIGAGIQFTIVVAADAGTSRDPNLTGTAAFSSSDPLATLPAAYTFVQADRGGKGFFVTLRTPGVQTIAVSDPANVLAPGTMTMTVTGPAMVNTPMLADGLKLLFAVALGIAGLLVLRTRL
jgi:hypothetical protein